MRRSLLLQTLGPMALVCLIGASFASYDAWSGRRERAALAHISNTREAFDRTLLRLLDRHQRAIQRTRLALEESDSDNDNGNGNGNDRGSHRRRAPARRPVERLSRISQQYSSDMSRLLARAEETMLALATQLDTFPGADGAADTFKLGGLREQLGRLLQDSTLVAEAMDRLLEVNAGAVTTSLPRRGTVELAAAETATTRSGVASGKSADPNAPRPEAGESTTLPSPAAGESPPLPSTETDESAPAPSPEGGESAPVPSPEGGESLLVPSPEPKPTEPDEPRPAITALLGTDPLVQQKREALLNLENADVSMQANLRLSLGMSRRVYLAQQRQLLRQPRLQFHWLIAALAMPVLFWLTLRPILRLRRLLAVESTAIAGLRAGITPITREEQAVYDAFGKARENEDNLTQALSQAQQQSERNEGRARRNERELALMRIYNENLVNSLNSAIVVTDTAGTVTSINRAARELLGLERADKGRPLETLALYRAIANRRPDIQNDLQRALDGEPQRLQGIPFVQTHAEEPQEDESASTTNATERLLDIFVVPYRDEGGAPRGLLWVSDDVTLATTMRDQLIAAEHLAAVGRLSSQVAHEIRNPLSAIGLNAELLEEELAQADGLAAGKRTEATALLQAIGREIERLSQVTESYLQLARMPRPQCQNTDLNQVVTDLFTMLDAEMKNRHINVKLDFASPAPRAWADPGQIRQALLNIIRNSSEAMADGGTLTVSTSDINGVSRVAVADSGSGIADDVIHRVFEPFYSTKPQGTGLGLSLTQQIIREHGGDILIHPLEKPGGTEVVLELPHASAA